MARLAFIALIGVLAVAARPDRVNAEASRHLSRRAPAASEPQTQPALKIQAMLAFKGKTVHILFEVEFPGDGTGASKTHFLADLLREAGAKVLLAQSVEMNAKAGDVLIMGEVEVPGPVDNPNPIDLARHDRRVELFKIYERRRKQLAADATAAGVQVVDGGHVAEFFGMNALTAGEFNRYMERATRARLERPLPEVKFDAVGLADVIDFLRDVSDIDIFVNWKALAAAGIDRDSPVTLNVRNVAFIKALRLVLDSAGGGKVKLDYEIDAGLVSISTAVNLFGQRISKTYDIRFLLPAHDQAARKTRVAALIKMVVASIDPPSWNAHPDKPCTITESNGELTVDQTDANQISIGNLLCRLHELMSLTQP